MRYLILFNLERFFIARESMAQSMAELCATCPECGRNRCSGKTCKGGN